VNTYHKVFRFRNSIWQGGLTLIEIMVALLIGAFLLAGVIQIFIANKQTYRVQENLSRIQENGRFAVDYLSRYIRMAGYVTKTPLNDNKALARNKIAAGSNSSGNITTTIFKPGTEAMGGADNSITVRFQADSPADGQMTDCLGNTVSSLDGDVIVTNVFSVKDYSLYCDPEHTINPDSTPVIGNVENIQFRYCIPVGSAKIGCVLSTAVSNWNEVQSVKVSLLLRSVDDNLVVQPKSYQFDADGDGVSETITPTDKRLRRVFTTTIAVRNLVN